MSLSASDVADLLTFTTTEYLIFVALLIFSWTLWSYIRTPPNLPPGPWGLPLLGYLPFMKEKSHVHFNELAKKYGDIFSIYIGQRLFIVLHSYEAIKEAFIKQSDIFAGRVGIEFVKKDEAPSIFASEGEVWRDYKRFTLSTLREFGLGKISLEPRINEEIQFLLNTIESYNSKPTDIGDLLRMSISNVICSIKFGHRFDYNNENFQYLIRILNEFLSRTEPVGLGLTIPGLLKIPGFKKLLGHKPSRELRDLLEEDIQKKIEERTKNHIAGSEDDFVSAWLTEAEKRGPVNGKNFTTKHLIQVIISLFVAGSDTTANTLRWGLLYLMEHPQVQQRVQKEIDDVIGNERMPSVTDRDQMPYTEATLMEIQRISTLVPLAILHCNTKETTLRGFHIPKRTVIVPNLWAVHFDPITYPEPEKFLPGRFLDSQGKLIKPEKFIPFSLGKRQCLGESLAKMELFVYFASMLQKFKFEIPKGDKLSFDYKMATVAVPKPYRLIATPRHATKSK